MRGPRDPMLTAFPRGAAVRLGLMTLLCAGLGYFALCWQPQPSLVAVPGSPEPAVPPVPPIDPAILAQVKDGTRKERLQVEPAALQHLLERALTASPPADQPLGLPEQ